MYVPPFRIFGASPDVRPADVGATALSRGAGLCAQGIRGGAAECGRFRAGVVSRDPNHGPVYLPQCAADLE